MNADYVVVRGGYLTPEEVAAVVTVLCLFCLCQSSSETSPRRLAAPWRPIAMDYHPPDWNGVGRSCVRF